MHGKAQMTKAVKTIAVGILLAALCSFCGCVASLLSGSVVVGKDYTQEETVGVISYFGFPVWFAKGASGTGYGGSHYPERWRANCRVWTVFFMCAAVLTATGLGVMKRKRKGVK